MRGVSATIAGTAAMQFAAYGSFWRGHLGIRGQAAFSELQLTIVKIGGSFDGPSNN